MEDAKSLKSKINAISTNGYELDFGTVFENAFANYKKIALYAGLMFLIFSIIILTLIFAGLFSYIGIESMEDFANQMQQFSSIKTKPLDIAIKINAAALLLSAITSPFVAGFFKMADCAEKGEEFNVSNMFGYYKSPYFSNIIGSVLIVGIITTSITVLSENIGLSLVGTVASLLLSFLTFLAIPLIVFANLNATEAIKYSALLVSKQPLVIVGLLIVSIIGAMVGFFGLCIGIFFTLPFVYSMNYVIYKSIVGIDETSEIEEISGN